jgi:hypothetical protein
LGPYRINEAMSANVFTFLAAFVLSAHGDNLKIGPVFLREVVEDPNVGKIMSEADR